MTRKDFAAKKWGVFCHYLNRLQNNDLPHNTLGRITDWSQCVEELDVEKLASQVSDLGAGYLVFTMQQVTRHFIAPNAAFESATGIKNGCARRDLVLDLHAALAKRGIDLFLYHTGDGIPEDEDPVLARQFGWQPDTCISRELVELWSGVLREYSLRYGNRISGWWLDGTFRAIGYDTEKLQILRNAALAGNPNALISNNHYGCYRNHTERMVPIDGNDVLLADFYQHIAPPTPCCDFTAGEAVHFNLYPDPARSWDAVPHVLSFMGIPPRIWEVYDGWGAGGCKYSPEYMARYIQGVNRLGGVVSVDMRLYRNGSLEDAQRRALESVNR